MIFITTQITKVRYGILLYNYGEETWKAEAGDRIAQAMFINFLITDDDNVETKRQGGWGSTNG